VDATDFSWSLGARRDALALVALVDFAALGFGGGGGRSGALVGSRRSSSAASAPRAPIASSNDRTCG